MTLLLLRPSYHAQHLALAQTAAHQRTHGRDLACTQTQTPILHTRAASSKIRDGEEQCTNHGQCVRFGSWKPSEESWSESPGIAKGDAAVVPPSPLLKPKNARGLTRAAAAAEALAEVSLLVLLVLK